MPHRSPGTTRIRPLPILGFLLLAAAAALVACGTRDGAAAAGPEPVELRSYTVPEAYAEEARRTLRFALGTDEDRIGRVEAGPGGKLVVVAPPGVHAGVERFLRELSSLDAPPSAPRPVALSYWILVGRPASGTGYRVAPGADLSAVAPAMEQLAATMGPTEFGLLEHLRLTSIDGRDFARAHGRVGMVGQRATVAGDDVVAEVQINLQGGHSLQTQVVLEPGQLLVLGQSGYSGRAEEVFREGPAGGPLMLYYVVVAGVD